MVSLLSPLISAKLLSNQRASSLYRCKSWPSNISRYRTWHTPELMFKRLFSVQTAKTSPHGSTQPPGSSTTSPRFFITYELYRSALCIMSQVISEDVGQCAWGTSLVTGLQLDLLPLITILWAGFFSFKSMSLSTYQEKDGIRSNIKQISIFRIDKDCCIFCRVLWLSLVHTSVYKSQRPHFGFQNPFNNSIGLQASFILAFV